VDTLCSLEFDLFLGGLAFLFMAGVARGLSRRPGERLPWFWLALLGAGQGLTAWLDLSTLGLHDLPALKLFRLAVTAASFVALLEFGRRGLNPSAHRDRAVGPWIYLPCVVLVAAAAMLGEMSGLEAACRYALGLPGGVLAGLALWQASRSAPRGSGAALRAAALALLIYAAAAGLVAPKATFFPASWLHEEAFSAAAGAHIQLVRAICAMMALTGIWAHQRRLAPLARRAGLVQRWLYPAVFVLLVAVGWLASGWYSHDAVAEMREELPAPAKAVAIQVTEDQQADSAAVSAAWIRASSQRLRTGLPVVVVLLLALGSVGVIFGTR
jgi:hypothetical protein